MMDSPSSSCAQAPSIKPVDGDCPSCDLKRIALGEATHACGGVVEQKARLPVAAYQIRGLMSREACRRLVRSGLNFATGPDSVDNLPTFESFVFDRGEVLHERSCRVLEAVVESLLPYLRARFRYGTLALSQALLRRYLPNERRAHPAHFDAHAAVTVVVALNDPEEYVGGYYAQPTPRSSSRRFARLGAGDAFCHSYDLRHGVEVRGGERYSLVLWFKPRRCVLDGSTPWYDRAARKGDADATYNLAALLGMRARRLAERGDAAGAGACDDEAARLYERSGTADADLNAGVLAKRRGDAARAAGLWLRAARRGKATAMRYLGTALLRGDGVPRDAARGARWLEKAARGGDAPSAYALHRLAPAGDAARLAAAAAAGHPDACLERAGECVDLKDARSAVVLLKRASANGAAPDANCVLGKLYLADAPGVPVDRAAAAACFAASGTSESLLRLAALYCGGAVPRPRLRDETKAEGQLVLWSAAVL